MASFGPPWNTPKSEEPIVHLVYGSPTSGVNIIIIKYKVITRDSTFRTPSYPFKFLYPLGIKVTSSTSSFVRRGGSQRL